jgi:hypothetical protein
MRWKPTPLAAYLLGLAVLAALPVADRALEARAPERCAADGRALAGTVPVRVVSAEEGTRRFCCASCADRWLRARDPASAEVFVVDETSGAEMPAGAAHFVRSLVAHPVTRDRVHVFADRGDAERHARAYAGILLEGFERPFSRRRLRRDDVAGTEP